jgi:hypothetical protein
LQASAQEMQQALPSGRRSRRLLLLLRQRNRLRWTGAQLRELRVGLLQQLELHSDGIFWFWWHSSWW